MHGIRRYFQAFVLLSNVSSAVAKGLYTNCVTADVGVTVVRWGSEWVLSNFVICVSRQIYLAQVLQHVG